MRKRRRSRTRKCESGIATSSDVGIYREGSGRVRTSLGEQQRPGRRGQISKVRLERALIAGMGSSALPSAQEIRRLVGLGLRAWHIGNGLVP